MANGLYQTTVNFDLAAGVVTKVYDCPSSILGTVISGATITLNLCNRGGLPALLRIARGVNASPLDADWQNYDSQVGYGEPSIRAGMRFSPGDRLWVLSNIAGVSASVEGIEK